MAYWRVRELAEPERWSARKLALATGLAYNTVWLIWTGKAKRADLETLEAIARVLKVSPGELIGSGEQTTQEGQAWASSGQHDSRTAHLGHGSGQH